MKYCSSQLIRQKVNLLTNENHKSSICTEVKYIAIQLEVPTVCQIE